MASKYVNDIREIADKAKSEGWDLRASVLSAAADRMERMEALIVDLLKDDIPNK